LIDLLACLEPNLWQKNLVFGKSLKKVPLAASGQPLANHNQQQD